MTHAPDLGESPVELVAGEPVTVWENGHQRLSLIPTVEVQRPAISFGDGRPLDGSGVLAFDGARILLVRQNRYAAGVQTWEIPLGGIDTGESPAEAAARELMEETGIAIRAADLASLGTIRPNASRLTGSNWLYLGVVGGDLEAAADLVEISDAVWFGVDAVVDACVDGTLTCPSTVSAVLRARIIGLI